MIPGCSTQQCIKCARVTPSIKYLYLEFVVVFDLRDTLYNIYGQWRVGFSDVYFHFLGGVWREGEQ